MVEKSSVGVSQRRSMSYSDGRGVISCDRVDSFGDNWGVSDGDGFYGRGAAIDDGVETMDIISGVGDSSDSAVWFDKGVLSLYDISVTGLAGGFGISCQTVRDRVSVVVLWMRVIWLWLDGDGFDGWDNSFSQNWGMGVGRGVGVSHGWSVGISWSSCIGWSGDDAGAGDDDDEPSEAKAPPEDSDSGGEDN